MSKDPEDQASTNSLRKALKESFIQDEKAPLPIRILKKIDIFSFIPVPKDDPVSTKQSLIGTAVFFIIFLTYIIFDFYQFVSENPPNAQNYYTKLDDTQYQLPRFGINYMTGNLTEISGSWQKHFTFSLTKQWKDPGSQDDISVPLILNDFNKTGSNQTTIEWIDKDTRKFYNMLRSSSQPLYAKGLLYSTRNASYARLKLNLCNLNDPNNECLPIENISKFCAEGRIFLFIQNIQDTTDFAESQAKNSPNKFSIFNSFLEPFIYKRLAFNFQVVKTVVKPDYFFRWSDQQQTRLQIGNYIQQSSNVSLNAINVDTISLNMLSVTFQLAPQILNVRVTYRTLIDHISMWGATWGVLFAIFAIIFLTYNRKKFYKKNPGWDKFKKNQQSLHEQHNHYNQEQS